MSSFTASPIACNFKWPKFNDYTVGCILSSYFHVITTQILISATKHIATRYSNFYLCQPCIAITITWCVRRNRCLLPHAQYTPMDTPINLRTAALDLSSFIWDVAASTSTDAYVYKYLNIHEYLPSFRLLTMYLLTWQIQWADKRSSSIRELSCVANMKAAKNRIKTLKQPSYAALKRWLS